MLKLNFPECGPIESRKAHRMSSQVYRLVQVLTTKPRLVKGGSFSPRWSLKNKNLQL